MKKLLLTVVVCVVACYSSLGDDSRIIRRLYLDTVGVPPTIEELEWYTVYNDDGYSLAVEYVINKTADAELKNFYLSAAYKTSSDTLIAEDVLNKIIKYQIGKLDVTSAQADEELIRLGELQYTAAADVVDYFSYCLMSRSTTLEETNKLLNIFRKAKTEKDGYKDILSCMKTFKDYLYK